MFIILLLEVTITVTIEKNRQRHAGNVAAAAR